MALRATALAAPATARATADVQALRRAALWGMLAAKLWGGWGVTWDIQWHILIGRDSFWIPPHLMTYSAVTAIAVLSLGCLLYTSPSPRD